MTYIHTQAYGVMPEANWIAYLAATAHTTDRRAIADDDARHQTALILAGIDFGE